MHKSTLGLSWAHSGPLWDQFGSTLRHAGACWGHLETSWFSDDLDGSREADKKKAFMLVSPPTSHTWGLTATLVHHASHHSQLILQFCSAAHHTYVEHFVTKYLSSLLCLRMDFRSLLCHTFPTLPVLYTTSPSPPPHTRSPYLPAPNNIPTNQTHDRRNWRPSPSRPVYKAHPVPCCKAKEYYTYSHGIHYS